MPKRAGFTIVEIVIVMVIMAVLLTLTVVTLSGSQVNGRDAKRKADAEAIARGLELRYKQGNASVSAPSTVAAGSYPTTAELRHMLGHSVAGFTPAQITGGYLTDGLPGTSANNFYAPGRTTVSLAPLCTASCQPAETATVYNTTTIDTYYYEPITTANAVCTSGTCVRFVLYYRLEKDGSLQSIKSSRQ